MINTKARQLHDITNSRYQWLVFAIASGACAAMNGTFAKLTTTSLTTSLSRSLPLYPPFSLLPYTFHSSIILEYTLRAIFFSLNILFDTLMWTLFTRALTLATSSVHVSVLNTGTNFLIAALAGRVVFGESLPPQWWLGAGLLMAGCVVVGRGSGHDGEKVKINEKKEVEGKTI